VLLNWFTTQCQQSKKSPLQVLSENLCKFLQKRESIRVFDIYNSPRKTIKKSQKSADIYSSKIYRIQCKSYTTDGLEMQSLKFKMQNYKSKEMQNAKL
jgi:hypothetical protein